MSRNRISKIALIFVLFFAFLVPKHFLLSYEPKAEYSEVALKDLRESATIYKSSKVKFVIRFNKHETTFQPFFTIFTPDEFLPFAGWSLDKKLWVKEDRLDDFPFLFIRKDNKDVDKVLTARKYSELVIYGTVTNDFHKIPWIEVDFVDVKKGPQLTDDILKNLIKAEELLKAGDKQASAYAIKMVFDSRPPYTESLYAAKTLATLNFQLGNLQDALKYVNEAIKLSPKDTELVALRNNINEEIERQALLLAEQEKKEKEEMKQPEQPQEKPEEQPKTESEEKSSSFKDEKEIIFEKLEKAYKKIETYAFHIKEKDDRIDKLNKRILSLIEVNENLLNQLNNIPKVSQEDLRQLQIENLSKTNLINELSEKINLLTESLQITTQELEETKNKLKELQSAKENSEKFAESKEYTQPEKKSVLIVESDDEKPSAAPINMERADTFTKNDYSLLLQKFSSLENEKKSIQEKLVMTETVLNESKNNQKILEDKLLSANHFILNSKVINKNLSEDNKKLQNLYESIKSENEFLKTKIEKLENIIKNQQEKRIQIEVNKYEILESNKQKESIDEEIAGPNPTIDFVTDLLVDKYDFKKDGDYVEVKNDFVKILCIKNAKKIK